MKGIALSELPNLCKTLLTRAEADSRFESLAISQLRTLLGIRSKVVRSRRLNVEALIKASPAEFAQRNGAEALRRYLEQFTTKDLREYVRMEGLSKSGVSKLAKDDVINRIMVAARSAA